MSPLRRRGRPAPHVGRVYRLGEDPRDDLAALTTAEERLALVWELTDRAWALTGRPFPSYDRRAIPVVVVRAGP